MNEPELDAKIDEIRRAMTRVTLEPRAFEPACEVVREGGSVFVYGSDGSMYAMTEEEWDEL